MKKLMFAAVAVFAGGALATDYVWTGAGAPNDQWAIPRNWSVNGVACTDDDAYPHTTDDTATFNPTFHVYHNFRLKNFYILEKQPIIVEFLADFVSRGSVVKTEQKPTVGRSFDNNSRERGKSG